MKDFFTLLIGAVVGFIAGFAGGYTTTKTQTAFLLLDKQSGQLIPLSTPLPTPREPQPWWRPTGTIGDNAGAK